MRKYGLENREYDDYLAKNKKERELQARNSQRRNGGYKGWHWGLGERPVYTRNKEEYKRELDKRGLMMKDDVKRRLR